MCHNAARREVKCHMLGSLAERLTFLRAVDPAQADNFSVVVVQDFEGVAVNYPGYSSGEVSSTNSSWDEHGCQQQELCPMRDHDRCTVATDCHRVARRSGIGAWLRAPHLSDRW